MSDFVNYQCPKCKGLEWPMFHESEEPTDEEIVERCGCQTK